MNYHLHDRPCVLCNERDRECGLPRLYCKKCANDLLKGRSQAGSPLNIVGLGGQSVGGAHQLRHVERFIPDTEEDTPDVCDRPEGES